MSEKKRNILLSVFLSLLIVTLMSFSLTQARYSKEPESGSDISGDIDFVVSQSIVIESVDDFFTAIENGYTNIQISDEVDNPLVITGGVADVNSDLTIDLNGHEIQRNNREPMLDIQEGVRLTITDSKGGGGFYNPVGSVLRISGGTLTVTNGLFESGPRNGVSMAETDGAAEHESEYATSSGSVYSTPAGASASESKPVFYYEKSGASYTKSDEITAAPILVPNAKKSTVNAGRFVVNGNMYFENGAEIGGFTVDADTYLYYTLEGDNIDNTTIATEGSADFYYEYYVTQDASTGAVTYAGTSAGENTLLVTVYGYQNAKGAANPTGSGAEIPEYAAIQMQSGNIYVRGGGYTSYFGEKNTYCVYATGGNMAVENGTFEAHGNGTCVSMAIVNAGGTAEGESEEALRIAHGAFYSQVGDTISVAAGTMRVTGGSFYKDATSGTGTAAGANNAIINISGGTLEVTGAADSRITFDLTGSYMYGIESAAESRVGEAATLADAGRVTVTNADFTFNGGSNAGAHTTNYGISSSAGTIDVAGCIFVLPDQGSRGISVENGTVTVGGATKDALPDGSANLTQDTDRYSYFYVDSNVNSYGVYAGRDDASTENITVNMDAAQLFVGQKRKNGAENEGGAGVYLNAGDNSQINLGEVYVLAAGNSVSGIVAESGSISQTDSARENYTNKLVVITGATYSGYESGKTCFLRSIDSYTNKFVAQNPLDVTTTSSSDSHGVYSAGGEITLNSAFVAQFSANAAGVYSTGGSITVADAFDVFVNIAGNTQTTNVLATTAVSVEENAVNSETAALIFNGAVDVRTDGLGITARGGATINVFGNLDLVSTRGTGIYVNNGTLTLGAENSPNTVNITTTIDQNTIWGSNVTTHYDGVTVEGGSLKSYGTFNVIHKGLSNDSYSRFDELVVKSYAVRVAAPENATAQVVILEGSIVNSVGGGLYVSGDAVTGTSGTTYTAQVTLGIEDMDDNLAEDEPSALQISTTGDTEGNSYHDIAGAASNWDFKENVTGGHAVEVVGGQLTVWGGEFNSAFGNGILVSGGLVNIDDGTFIGRDVYGNSEDQSAAMPGAGASYGFKLYGGTVNIYGGTFGDPEVDGIYGGSGAFVMGTSSRATANIYAGTFNVKGTAGVSVYQNVDVYFGGSSAGADSSYGALSLSANSAAITVEVYSGTSSSITIYSGTYTGGENGIWYGEADTTLNIRGGTFNADEEYSTNRNARYALYINGGVNNYNNVHLSGGRFSTDGQYAIYCDSYDRYFWDDYDNKWDNVLVATYNAYGRNSATSGTYEQLSGEIRGNTRKYIVIATSTPTT